MRILLFLLATSLGGSLWAAAPVAEAEMKALYVYNFAMFTAWPDTRRTSITFCVLGDDNVAQAMKRFDGRTLKGLQVRVARLMGISGIERCDVLFVGEREEAALPQVFAELREAAVLTVTDTLKNPVTGFQLALDGQRLVFDVNLEACRRANLMPESRLLRLARQVQKN